MSNGEFEGVCGREVRGQDAFIDAAAPEDLAGGAGAEDDGRGRRRRGRRGGGGRG